MNGLPSGIYLPGNSSLHRLNPCGKILVLLILVAAVVLTDRIAGYLILLALAGTAVLLSGLPAAAILSSLRRLLPFFLVILLMNLCFFSRENAWLQFWIFTPSPEGLRQGIHVTARVAFLLVFGNVLTATTAPLAMTDAIGRLLSPLRLLRIPTEQIAMILSVAIQFVPTLLEETDTIRKAQTARGARFDSKRLTEQAAAMPPLAVPIFLAAFRRADELSLAMEARGYRTDGAAAKPKQQPFAASDAIALLLCAGVCVIEILL